MDKKEYRRIALKERKTLADPSKLLIKKLIDSKILENAKRIGIYYPLPYEINPLSLIDKYKDKEFCFPKTIGDDIRFYLDENKGFLKGAFSVYEPISDILVDRDNIDAFIIPCVAITKDNKRIGYGKGYYDRYLEGYKGIKIALNYKELVNVDVDSDIFDVVIDYVIMG